VITLPVLALNSIEELERSPAEERDDLRWSPADWANVDFDYLPDDAKRWEHDLTAYACRGTTARWESTFRRYLTSLVRVCRQARREVGDVMDRPAHSPSEGPPAPRSARLGRPASVPVPPGDLAALETVRNCRPVARRQGVFICRIEHVRSCEMSASDHAEVVRVIKTGWPHRRSRAEPTRCGPTHWLPDLPRPVSLDHAPGWPPGRG
jgi:hypothetical protein